MADPVFTAAEKLACARREIAMRRRVYPGWIAGGRMTQAEADRQIAIMVAIAADYERAAAGDAGPLFGSGR
jgi:hypothetical protein